MDDGKINYRISSIGRLMLAITAIGFDFFEFIFDFIPIVGIFIAFFIDIMAIMIFSLWFLTKGVSLSSPKAVARHWLTHTAELLPFPVIDFCLTTVGVILMANAARKEDREKYEKEQKEKDNIIKFSKNTQKNQSSSDNRKLKRAA
jgi:hypothetical protein